MSLAEPRKRKKNPMHIVNLTAPNHWTNDDSKFGQKMLEKFGWSKGSGLGKNQQGISDNIKIQHKATLTGLGFIANNADDWFKAGEDYSRLLSQLTEKFDQYQALSETNEGQVSKKSLEQNSLNSKSRVHYHKFTKGKDLTQYKQKELMCILGKGVKDDNQNSNNLNIKEYFKLKQKNKKIQIDKSSLSINEDSVDVNIDDEANELITINEDMNMCTDINVTSPPKKKCDSQFSKEIEMALPNECDNVKLKKKKKKMKAFASVESDDKEQTNIPFVVEDIDQLKKKKKSKKLVETVNNSKQSIKNKSELLVDMYVNNVEQKKKNKSKLHVTENIDMECDYNDCNSDNTKETAINCNNYEEEIVTEQDSELVLTHKYQSLVELLIENSSAGKKYSKEAPSPLFEKKMKEFADSVKHQLATTVNSSETKPVTDESVSGKSKTLNPDDKNFINNFEIQKFKALESASKRQDVTKYVNDKSMFIAKHGDVLFFGSNINDIKGYGDW